MLEYEQMRKYQVSVQKFIPVPAQDVFDLVADPQQHPRFLESARGMRADIAAPEKLQLGSEFGLDMQIGAPFEMTHTVVEYEEGRRIAWQPRNDYVWRYTFEPVEGGTLVTEEWDARTSKRRFFRSMLGSPKHSLEGTSATLDRLHDLAVEEREAAQTA